MPKKVTATKIALEPEDANGKSITTAVHLPRGTWELLRAVAFHRAQDSGGRASVSKLVSELVEERRRELEKEIKSASK